MTTDTASAAATARPTAILVIDDDRDAVAQARQHLEASSARRFTVAGADLLADGLVQIQCEPFDAVVLAIALPDANGMDGVDRIREIAPTLPVFVWSDTGSDEAALDAIRAGAQDFLVKAPRLYPALPRIMGYAVERQQMLRQTQQLTDERKRAEVLFSKMLQVVSDAVVVTDRKGAIQLANLAMLRLLGVGLRDAIGKPIGQFLGGGTDISALDGMWLQAEVGDVPATASVTVDGPDGPIQARATSVSVEMQRKQRCFLSSFAMSLNAEADAELANALEEMQADVDVIAGRIQLVGLESVRARLGKDWDQFADKARQYARETIDRHLAPGDAFRETPKGDFLLVFKDPDENKAWNCAQLIALEVEQAILTAVVAQNDRFGLTDDEIDAIAGVSGNVAAATLSPDDAGSIDNLARAVEDRLRTATEQFKQNQRATLQQVERTGRPRFLAVYTAQRKRAPFALFQFDEQSQRMLERLKSSVEGGSEAERQLSVISLGRAIDLLLGTSERELPMLCVDLAVGLLQNPAERDRCLSICEVLDDRTRLRLALCLTDIGLNMPDARLQECVARIKPYCRLQMAEVNPRMIVARDPSQFGVSVIRVPYDQFKRAGARDGDGGRSLAIRTQRVGVRLLVTGIPSLAESNVLGRNGVDLMSLLQT
ncbi:MAG: response regulator [Alphaproteobacteria bacterium]